MLNDKNYPFFNSCDGIFINYTWKEIDPSFSCGFAKDRNFDVFTGIDVFGRNTFGGGGYDCHKVINF